MGRTLIPSESRGCRTYRKLRRIASGTFIDPGRYRRRQGYPVSATSWVQANPAKGNSELGVPRFRPKNREGDKATLWGIGGTSLEGVLREFGSGFEREGGDVVTTSPR